MEIIVGTITMKDDKILMVKEAKKECYGKWAFPAGHIEKNETAMEGAIRETLEETGCKVKIKKSFPIFFKNTNDMHIIMIHFLANLEEEKQQYNQNEILEKKWIHINEIKKMQHKEFRSFAVVNQIINDIESKNLYTTEIVKNMPSI